MKTPSFWNIRSNGLRLLSNLLLPFSIFYWLTGSLRRVFVKSKKLSVPVICIGNITVGGAGKTPVALAIGQILKDRGVNAFFLSRGYGGIVRGPLQVDLKLHGAKDVGDEPLLLARLLPTIIAHDRLMGAHYAIQQGAQAIIMDDGFQNPAIAKDISLLVIDGTMGLGNHRLIPAGPLRETLKAGLSRATAMVIINPGATNFSLSSAVITLTAQIRAQAHNLNGKNIVAFCGIGYPQKFFDTLTSLGIETKACIAYGDHHVYSSRDWKYLQGTALRFDAILVTTAKDAVRLPNDWRAHVTVLDIALQFDHPDMLSALLDKALHAEV